MSPITYMMLIPWMVYLSHWPLQQIDESRAASLAPFLFFVITDIRSLFKEWQGSRESLRATRSAIELAKKGSPL